jgi:hypothetical protein
MMKATSFRDLRLRGGYAEAGLLDAVEVDNRALRA